MRKLLATDLGIWPTLEDPARVADAVYRSNELKANLANYLLLFDQILVPTGNLLIIPVLRLWLGEDIFDRLFRDKTIVLCRYDE